MKIDDEQLSLFIFLSPECPLSQNYTKTVNELKRMYNAKVKVYGIVPGDAYTPKEVTDFGEKYKFASKLLIDSKQEAYEILAGLCDPTSCTGK